MVSILGKLIVAALAILLAAYVVPGITVASIYIALLVALVLGVMNIVVRPILVILTLPITMLSLGLFIFVINAFLFWFVGYLLPGFDVDGILAALLGSIIVSIAGTVADRLLP